MLVAYVVVNSTENVERSGSDVEDAAYEVPTVVSGGDRTGTVSDSSVVSTVTLQRHHLTAMYTNISG